MKKFWKLAALSALALSAATGAGTGHAETQHYPNRAIKWVVPYLAGTSPDLTVRIVADAMSRDIGQPIVIENRGGAGGNLGAQWAARAAADGYTWVYSGSPMATNMRMYRKPGFDVMKDFIQVGRISQSDSLLVVRADSGINSVTDLISRLKKEPGKMTYASGGIGSPSHMGSELLLSMTGTQALHVPYKGASESTTAVVGKQVDFAVSLIGPALPFLESGKLKPLAVLSPKRNQLLKDVPTLTEAGIAGVSLVSFGGLAVPKGTPAPIIEKIHGALLKALETPDVLTKMTSTGGTVLLGTGEQMAQALQDEIVLTERVMKSARIAPQ